MRGNISSVGTPQGRRRPPRGAEAQRNHAASGEERSRSSFSRPSKGCVLIGLFGRGTLARGAALRALVLRKFSVPGPAAGTADHNNHQRQHVLTRHDGAPERGLRSVVAAQLEGP